ncbi:hypothetical protein OU789_02745 [Halocynthiibacter sp. C4]|uniref:hypothetical protein n=1 Tax=Halocynthiibacter sp. C4 TaxID=2992758 RepID=UPI00237B87F4|nr:hypothetical protein [Halocynthiibacter sp. C4]MDE0588839.1 hypothetical protein [Halocynthiibacter sp. C4]
MSEPASRLRRTIVNLLLAMLNATLILVALCLYLELRVLQKVDNLTATFAKNLVHVEPLQDSVQALSSEVAELKTELVALRETPGKLTSAAQEELALRLDTLNEKVTAVKTSFDGVLQNPETLVAEVVNAGADAAVSAIADLRGCTLPENQM